MSVREYIGARYVPLFMGEWSNQNAYEPLSIVTNQGNSYTSRQAVPVGIDIANSAYWALTGNYNAQIDAYRTEVTAYREEVKAKPYSFATISAMKHSDELADGDICFTSGFNASNDGGSGMYVIGTNVQDANEMDVIECGEFAANLVLGDYITPTMLGAVGNGIADDTQQVERAFELSTNVKGHSGKRYAVNSVEVERVSKITDISLVCNASTLVDYVISVPRASYLENVEINANGNAKYCLHTNRTGISTSTKFSNICESWLYGAIESLIYCDTNSAIIVDGCKLLSSECAITGTSTDVKVYNTEIANCRRAFIYTETMSALTIDNVHVWDTEYPNDLETYNQRQSNARYAGESCVIYLAGNYPTINIGNIYIDTVTYFLLGDSSITYNYLRLNIEALVTHINTGFYRATDPQPLFQKDVDRIIISQSSTVNIGTVLVDNNDLRDSENHWWHNWLPAAIQPLQRAHFQVGLYQEQSIMPLWANYQYKPFYIYPSDVRAHVGAAEQGWYQEIVKSGNDITCRYRAPITSDVPAGSTIVTLNISEDNVTIGPELKSNAYYIDSTGKRTMLDMVITSTSIAIVNSTGATLSSVSGSKVEIV